MPKHARTHARTREHTRARPRSPSTTMTSTQHTRGRTRAAQRALTRNATRPQRNATQRNAHGATPRNARNTTQCNATQRNAHGAMQCNATQCAHVTQRNTTQRGARGGRCLQLCPLSRNALQNRLLAFNYLMCFSNSRVFDEHRRWGLIFQARSIVMAYIVMAAGACFSRLAI